MRVVVIGAGLGGLAAALRLQHAGYDVTVVEGRERPGGRAYQLRDGGFTWDTGPSLITMPWVLEDSFAAGGLDLHREVALRRLDPFYRIRWAGEERALDFVPTVRMPEQIAQFSSRDAAAFDGFLAALKPIYEQAILGAGRRPFLKLRDLLAFTPSMVRLGAALPLWRMVVKHFEHPRVRDGPSANRRTVDRAAALPPAGGTLGQAARPIAGPSAGRGTGGAIGDDDRRRVSQRNLDRDSGGASRGSARRRVFGAPPCRPKGKRGRPP